MFLLLVLEKTLIWRSNVSFAGSRKDINLEIVWFFAYWVIVHENTTVESMVNHS